MENNSIAGQGIRTGLIATAVSIVMGLVAFILNMNIAGWTFQGISYVLLIGVMIYGLLAFRKANGGYLAFAQGIGMVLIAGLICSIISYFFSLLYYNVLNPDAVNQVFEQSVATMEKWGVGASEEMKEQLRQSLEETTHFSVKGLTWGIVGALIMWSILGSILAAIFSKKNPEEIA